MNEMLNTFTEKYMNKREILYRLPKDINPNSFWIELLEFRKKNSIEVNLIDQKGNKMWFLVNDIIKSHIKSIDDIAVKDVIEHSSKDSKDSVIKDALIDEAFNSSVIEGAFSTKKRTKEIVEKNIEPQNKSEQMIKNNYLALEYILENIHKNIDEEMIVSIYKIITYKTLDDEDAVEKYRNDAVYVWDTGTNEVVYTAPHFSKIQDLMNILIAFINQSGDNLHPIVKASIIHFYFVYIHPFFDGNGRTARALSYMYLLKNGYNFFKFFSVSSVIKEDKGKYYKAIKDVEDYESDLTYFILFNIEMIKKSIIKILKYFQAEFGYRLVKWELAKNGIELSKRLNKSLAYYMKSEKNFTTIEEYSKKFKVVYETARTDLFSMEDLGIFSKSKSGKKYIFKMNELTNILSTIKIFNPQSD